jgi:hypothetical protein
MAGKGNGNDGRKKVSDMSQAEIQREVRSLLSELEGADDQATKRNLRAALRRLGHTGGLGERKASAPKGKAAKGKPAAKKGGKVVGRRAQSAGGNRPNAVKVA